MRKLSENEIEAIDLIEEIGLEIGHEYLQQPGQVPLAALRLPPLASAAPSPTGRLFSHWQTV